MKTIYTKKLQSQIRILGIVFFLLILIVPAFAQGDTVEKKETKMKFYYLKKSDDSKNLVCEMSVKQDKERFFIKDLPIKFYYSGDSSINLGTVKSNNTGVASFTIPTGSKIAPNKDGAYSYKAVYDGNDVFEGVEAELLIKDVQLEMVLTEDSLKYITVNASSILGNEKIPVEGSSVVLYVKRSLGLLKIKDQEMTAGTAQFDFPGDIPGDKDGNLTIIAKFEDDENFGTVEKEVVKKWGVPTSIQSSLNARELWSPDAPLWMSITLFILILAVVIHYIIIFYKLYQINKAGKE